MKLAEVTEPNRRSRPSHVRPSHAVEAIVRRVAPDVRVVIPGLGPELSDPCVLAAGLTVAAGDRVLTLDSNEGRRWVIAVQGGGDG